MASILERRVEEGCGATAYGDELTFLVAQDRAPVGRFSLVVVKDLQHVLAAIAEPWIDHR